MQLLNTNSTSYKKIKPLGEGSFGEIFLVENIKNNNLLVSKEMRLQGLPESTVIQLYTEVKVLEAIKHPNIIEMYETYRTKSNKLVIILEYAQNGDLANKIKSYNGKLIEEEQIRLWIIQLCLALKHSHDHKIIHRDLKTSNVFLDAENNVKLGDFGLAMNLIHSRYQEQGIAGTPLYLSPEGITKGICSVKSDIWALGIILYELCAQKHPFMASNFGHLIHKICNEEIPELPDVYSADLRQFIMSLLERDEKKRPNIGQIFETDIIQNILIKNKNEFKKLINLTTSNNLKINDNGLKKGFSNMKVYRFSEYKDPNVFLSNIQSIVNKEEKASRFKNQYKEMGEMVSDSESEDSNEEEPSFQETQLRSGMKINIFQPIEEESNTVSDDEKCPDQTIVISQFNYLVKDKVKKEKNPQVERLIDDSNNLSPNYMGQGVNFDNSMLRSAYNITPKNDTDIKTTFDTTNRNSKFFNKDDKDVIDSFLNGNEYGSLNLDSPKADYTKVNESSFNRDLKYIIDGLNDEIDDSNNSHSERISYNYTYSKCKDSIRNSQMDTFDYNLQDDSLNSPRSNRSEKFKPSFKDNLPKKSAFVQYKDDTNVQKPVQVKFKISTAEKLKKPSNRGTNHASVEKNLATEDKKDILTTPVKTPQKRLLIKKLTYDSAIPKSEKKENEFKLKPKGIKTAIKEKKVIRINLHSLADLPSNNQLRQLSNVKKISNIQTNSKCKAIISINNLCSLGNTLKKQNTKTSDLSDKSIGKITDKLSTSIMNEVVEDLDEYGMSVFQHKQNRDNIKNHNPLSFNDIKKINRKSKISEVERVKVLYIEKFGSKFNLIYSTIKKFLVHFGLQAVEDCLEDTERISQMLDNYNDGKLRKFKGRKSFIDLIRLSIMEIKCDLL